MPRRRSDAGNGTQEISAMAVATGRMRYDRRLSDKVLAAFNHAYGLGELDTAERLCKILRDLEARYAPDSKDRRRHRPLDDAERWRGFVAARERYRAACEANPAKQDEFAAALADMKAAYRHWSGA